MLWNQATYKVGMNRTVKTIPTMSPPIMACAIDRPNTLREIGICAESAAAT